MAGGAGAIAPSRFAFAGVPFNAAERVEYSELSEQLRDATVALERRFGLTVDPIPQGLQSPPRRARPDRWGGQTAVSPFDRTARTLEDFLEFTDAAARLVARGKADYDNDEMLRLAAEALLHKIGEVVSRLDRDDPALIAEHPEVSWRPMKGMRNLVAHGCGAADPEIVWTTLEQNLPQEASQNRRLLDTRTGHS